MFTGQHNKHIRTHTHKHPVARLAQQEEVAMQNRLVHTFQASLCNTTLPSIKQEQ